MHAISNYRGNRPTHKHTHKNPQTGTITIHCAAKLNAQFNKG